MDYGGGRSAFEYKGRPRQYLNYVNIPPAIGMCVSAKFASLHELDTIYGLVDLYDMIEIFFVDAFNEREANRQED